MLCYLFRYQGLSQYRKGKIKDSWQLSPLWYIDELSNGQDETKHALAVPSRISYEYKIP